MNDLIELRDVLLNAGDLPWRNSIFLPKDKNWNLNSLCFLFNLDDLEDDEEVPQFAIDNNLIDVLNMSEVQDIVCNANQQRVQCSESSLFEAFLYYYKNDAFIIFS